MRGARVLLIANLYARASAALIPGNLHCLCSLGGAASRSPSPRGLAEHLYLMHTLQMQPAVSHNVISSTVLRAILWMTFWEVCGGFGGNFQKLPPNFSEVEITRRNALWGNFLEVCFRNPGTSEKSLQKSALRCIRLFSILSTISRDGPCNREFISDTSNREWQQWHEQHRLQTLPSMTNKQRPWSVSLVGGRMGWPPERADPPGCLAPRRMP